ncbi:hypothetical protein SLEP1_g51649 [Rubroshorea leprosula]|uniref:Uncharacterized protein n=1 Tax=Rubroshorea leprosula TaxID=152421 RepID=A0AAV5M3X8_9ROSI|nr:hypothetical protein SLEP1_g51649 [Rubroshorea leprosula]
MVKKTRKRTQLKKLKVGGVKFIKMNLQTQTQNPFNPNPKKKKKKKKKKVSEPSLSPSICFFFPETNPRPAPHPGRAPRLAPGPLPRALRPDDPAPLRSYALHPCPRSPACCACTLLLLHSAPSACTFPFAPLRPLRHRVCTPITPRFPCSAPPAALTLLLHLRPCSQPSMRQTCKMTSHSSFLGCSAGPVLASPDQRWKEKEEKLKGLDEE